MTPESLTNSVRSTIEFGNEASIEQHVSGEIWNMDLLVVDGEPHLISLTQRIGIKISTSCHAPRSKYRLELEQNDLSKYNELAYCIAKTLNYRAGPMTVDFVMSAEEPVILEVSPHFHTWQVWKY